MFHVNKKEEDINKIILVKQISGFQCPVNRNGNMNLGDIHNK